MYVPNCNGEIRQAYGHVTLTMSARQIGKIGQQKPTSQP